MKMVFLVIPVLGKAVGIFLMRCKAEWSQQVDEKPTCYSPLTFSPTTFAALKTIPITKCIRFAKSEHRFLNFIFAIWIASDFHHCEYCFFCDDYLSNGRRCTFFLQACFLSYDSLDDSDHRTHFIISIGITDI